MMGEEKKKKKVSFYGDEQVRQKPRKDILYGNKLSELSTIM
jgi:hypothetical protein